MNVYEIEEHGCIYTCSNEPIDPSLIRLHIFSFLDELCCDYYENDHCICHDYEDYSCHVIFIVIIDTSVFQICVIRELLGEIPKYYYNCFIMLIGTPDQKIKSYYKTDSIITQQLYGISFQQLFDDMRNVVMLLSKIKPGL